MLLLSDIQNQTQEIIDRLAKRKIDARQTIHQIKEADDNRKKTQKELDDLLARSNQISKEIGNLFREGKKNQAEAMKAETVSIKTQTGELQKNLADIEEEILSLLVTLPNTPHANVPEGASAEENKEVGSWGSIPTLGEDALPHWDLAKKYNLIDFELGVKISGAGFPVYTDRGARLQRALINFFLDENRNAGYTEYQPPHFVNETSGFGTGQLPDKEGQMYHITEDNLYAIPTAEVPVTNFFRDEILDADRLPVRCTAYTPCFRREAGSYGKDVRGLNRLHQFDKVEIVNVAHPEQSYAILDDMVKHVGGLLQKLNLPYRVLLLCGGDMGFASAMTYDFEVWSAAQKRWLEVSSVSNFETYQSNRLKLRFRGSDKKTQLCHTLNGSAMALPRVLAALLENHQTPDGINIPEVLHPYTGFDKID